MRQQRLFRASSSQTLCVFCACRSLGHELFIPPRRPFLSATAQRHRPIHTTRTPRQSAEAVAVQSSSSEEINGNGNPNSYQSFDVNSPLSPAERAAKERRQQQRREELEFERERERRHVKALERRQAQVNERQAGAAEPRAQFRQRVHRTAANREATPLFRKHGVKDNSSFKFKLRASDTLPVPPQRVTSDNISGNGGSPEDRRHDVFVDTKSRNVRHFKKTVGMPDFSAGTSTESRASTTRSASAGWGSGKVDSTPSLDGIFAIDNTIAENEGDGISQQPKGFDESESVVPEHIQEFDESHSNQNGGFVEMTPPAAVTSPGKEGFDLGLEDTGYRASPFDPSDFASSAIRYHESEHANDWQHLSRRNFQSDDPPPPPPRQSHSQRMQGYQNDAESIDRQFRQHQRERETRTRQQPLFRSTQFNPNISDVAPEFSNPPARTPMRCARCLEPGHSARECTGPTRATCNYCGSVGHMKAECPKNPMNSANRVTREQSNGRGSLVRTVQGQVFQNDADLLDTRPFPQSVQRQQQQPVFESATLFGPRTQEREQQSSPAEPEENSEERRARSRGRRGFEEEDDAVETDPFPERRTRRQGRSYARRDDEAEDESFADREERAARKAARKAERKADREALKREQATQIHLPAFINVSNLAQTLAVHYDAFVERLEELGYDDIFPGKTLNAETSGMIAMEYNFNPVFEEEGKTTEEEERDLKARPEVEDKTFLPSRPPVVTIMGHVDHGKTTILDYIRKSSVAAGEAGGITQHIGAFSVPLSATGKTITFLDTPGHAAFLAMRQRGANVTDIVILVVAADDSVKPQTLESLRCAREAGVPIIVAVNKIDKEEADLQRVKGDLARAGLDIEDYGGDTQVVPVSGKTGKGMEELEEAVVTLSEILDHRSDMDGAVEGWVLEATTKKSGRVATVLVKRGTLRPGAVIVAGKTWARVRSLRNERDEILHEATPGMPVEIDGWKDQPVAGDEALQAPSEQKASSVVAFREEKAERERAAVDTEAINEARRLEQEKRRAAEESTAPTEAEQTTVNEIPKPEEVTGQLTVPFIIKADVSGSAEAVSAYIPSLTSPFITPTILHSGVGAIHESDIELAAAASGHIIAFNLPPNEGMKGEAESRGVKVLENNVIYRVLDDVKAVLEEKLPPIVTQRVLGEAEIGQKFEIGLGGRKKMWIAGCKVRNGMIGKSARVKVFRGGEKVYDGKIDSLKNVKKDVQEMRKGTECGMGFDEWEGFEVGDLVQTYEEISEKRRL